MWYNNSFTYSTDQKKPNWERLTNVFCCRSTNVLITILYLFAIRSVRYPFHTRSVPVPHPFSIRSVPSLSVFHR